VNENLVRNCLGIVSFLSLLVGSTRSASGRAIMFKAAGIGALSGAALSIATNKRRADDILAATAIGAGIGARLGAIMGSDLSPGTQVERSFRGVA